MDVRRTPMRRCIACMTSYPKDELIRLTVKDEIIIRDGDKAADGRGYYICPRKVCLEKVIRKKVFNRILRRNMNLNQIEEVIGNIVDTEVIDGKED
ncbi:MAG: YlxR family protein [Anaerovoracaceae bacterium]